MASSPRSCPKQPKRPIALAPVLLAVIAPHVWAEPTIPPIRVAYFVPSDREPLPGHQERLDRVMTEVQRFYRDGMASAGYGPVHLRA